MNYTTQANVEGYLKRSLTTQESGIIQLLLDSADTVIESETDRVFADDETDTKVWYFDAPNKYRKTIGDLAQVPDTSLFLDGYPIGEVDKLEYMNANGDLTEIDPSDYVTYPLNGPGVDYIEFRAGYWVPGMKNIKITGKSNAYKNVPKAISLAATILVCEWLNANTAKLKQENIEGYSRTFYDLNSDGLSPEVDRLLSPYRRVMI